MCINSFGTRIRGQTQVDLLSLLSCRMRRVFVGIMNVIVNCFVSGTAKREDCMR